MQLYVIRRRSYWKSVTDLEAAAARSRRIGDNEMRDQVCWIRSYVLKEADGSLGTACIYQAAGPQAIRAHASRVGMPADEIVPVAARLVEHADPAAFGFVVRRRGVCDHPGQFEAFAQRMRQMRRIGSERGGDTVNWIRSYVVHEADGRTGTLCVVQAASEQAIRAHARAVGLPVQEIVPIAARVVMHDDPVLQGIELAAA